MRCSNFAHYLPCRQIKARRRIAAAPPTEKKFSDPEDAHSGNPRRTAARNSQYGKLAQPPPTKPPALSCPAPALPCPAASRNCHFNTRAEKNIIPYPPQSRITSPFSFKIQPPRAFRLKKIPTKHAQQTIRPPYFGALNKRHKIGICTRSLRAARNTPAPTNTPKSAIRARPFPLCSRSRHPAEIFRPPNAPTAHNLRPNLSEFRAKLLDARPRFCTFVGIMADKNEKNEFNVAGKFYVDSQCIGCALCTSTAEGFFEISDAGCAFVAKQPSSADETSLCEEAKDSCPVQAIGDDGE